MGDYEPNNESLNIPEQLQSNLHYFNLNNQLKYDLEQQNAIKIQQLEAIKLIQVSLEKLTATTTVPLHNQTTRKNNSTPPPTILVYKETNLHKNLLVSKVLNKAKYFYYQSIVQTMRLSLMSKLNYYSSLIQQLYPNETSKLNNLKDSFSIIKNSADETSLIDEMRVLMQQILHDTYQFNNFNNSSNSSLIELANIAANTTKNDKVLKECSASDLNKPSEKKIETIKKKSESLTNNINEEQSNNEQERRIKQLNDVKYSLYSLLFPQSAVIDKNSNDDTSPLDSTIETNQTQDLKNKHISQIENVAKRKLSHINVEEMEEDDNVNNKYNVQNQSNHKRSRRTNNKIYSSIDSNNNHVNILSDDTNVIVKSNNINNNKKQRSKQHISTKLLKLSLKTATKSKTIVTQPAKYNLEPESFINLEVLV